MEGSVVGWGVCSSEWYYGVEGGFSFFFYKHGSAITGWKEVLTFFCFWCERVLAITGWKEVLTFFCGGVLLGGRRF